MVTELVPIKVLLVALLMVIGFAANLLNMNNCDPGLRLSAAVLRLGFGFMLCMHGLVSRAFCRV